MLELSQSFTKLLQAERMENSSDRERTIVAIKLLSQMIKLGARTHCMLRNAKDVEVH